MFGSSKTYIIPTWWAKEREMVGNTKLWLALMFHKCAPSGIRSIPNVNVSPWMSYLSWSIFLYSFPKRISVCITCFSSRTNIFLLLLGPIPVTPPIRKLVTFTLVPLPFRSVMLIKLCTSSFFLNISIEPVLPIVLCLILHHSRTWSGLQWIGQVSQYKSFYHPLFWHTRHCNTKMDG